MDLIKIILNKENYLEIHLSIWFLLILLVISGVYIWWVRRKMNMEFVNLKFTLGNIGEVELKPNFEDSQIAHRIWTELETRKAGQELNLEEDIIVEIYDSWYSLFQVMRQAITQIPIQKFRHNESTQQIANITLQALNRGLRPHLTKWQGRFRNWYLQNQNELSNRTPQELQRKYPEYDDLTNDLSDVNKKLIEFKNEIKKLF